jgi:hypothetical protein
MNQNEAGDVSRVVLETMLHPDRATSQVPVVTLTKE